MIGWLIAIAIISLVLFTPFGIKFSYLRSGMKIKAFIGFITIHLYPMKKMKEPKKAKPLKAQKATKSNTKPENEPFRLVGGDIPDLWRIFKRAANGFTRLIKIAKLHVCLTPGGEDAAQTALRYGYANAAIGLLMPLILRHFRVGSHRCEVRLRYDAPKLTCYTVIQLNFTLWRTLIFGFLILGNTIGFLRRHRQRLSSQKQEAENIMTNEGKTVA